MSAVPSPILQDVETGVGPGSPKLATKAAAYFFVVALATAVTVVPLLARLTPDTPGWTTFVILGSIAAVAQLFVVRTPRNQSYHTTIVFLIPAAMLLPPELVALMGLIQHIPEWLKNRSAWYIQIFNICNWTLAILAAYAAFHGILRLGSGSDVDYALAGIRRRRCDRDRQPRADGADAAPCARPLDPRVGALLVPEPLDRPRARDARRGNGRLLGLEPVADPLRGCAAAADPPLALGTAAPGGGARRSQDGALQRTPLRRRAERGARASGALRASALARDGRPRPPARHQQHLRAPRRRRRPARASPRSSARSCATTTCRPGSAARSSRSCFRRRRRSRPSRSPSGSVARSPPAHSTSRPRASRSGRRSRSASPATRATARTRTS